LLEKAYDKPVQIWEDYGYQKQAMFVCMEPDKWEKARKFAVVRELKTEVDRKQLKPFRKQRLYPCHVCYQYHIRTRRYSEILRKAWEL